MAKAGIKTARSGNSIRCIERESERETERENGRERERERVCVCMFVCVCQIQCECKSMNHSSGLTRYSFSPCSLVKMGAFL